MKTNGTQKFVIAVIAQLFFFIIHFSANAQLRYDFKNASKITGTDRAVGAQYRFPNVRSGVDALVTITAITGGLTITTLDGTSSGFGEAFQPEIRVPARSKGYAEFSIVFVTSGTTIPLLQTEVPVTPIDVDGKSGNVFEYDVVYRSSSSYVDYNMLGNELAISYPTANMVQGLNTAGVDYGGIDTVAKQVMFTVVNAGISTLVVRVGADNRSNQSQDRLRSLYFQRFNYPNSILASSALPAVRENKATNSQFFKAFPSVINDRVNVNYKSDKDGRAVLKLIDYSGRMVMQKEMNVNEGQNSFVINDLGKVASGNYIMLITQGDLSYNQKLLKQ